MSLYDERLKNLNDAVSFREPDKVPVGIEIIHWPFSYAGTTYYDLVDDAQALATAYTKFINDVDLDFYALGIGLAQPIRVHEALGSLMYKIADDHVLIEHTQTIQEFMKDDEYDELIADYPGFRKKLMQRNFKAFQGSKAEAYAALKKAAIAMKTHDTAQALIAETVKAREIVGLQNMGPGGAPMYFSPFNALFDFVRGMKDSLIDLRRRPDKVNAAIEVIKAQPGFPAPSPDIYIGRDPIPLSGTVYHSECFLNNQQFDELFFQGFKESALPYMEKGAKYFLKGEGRFLNTLDRFRELPKGAMVIVLDQDDPFEAFKIIGDHATLCTGINTDLMLSGTKQQNLDYVKRCFDTFAPGGGFLFMSQKPLISANEVNVENLLAVYELAHELGKQ